MRHTHAHTRNRRAHHALSAPAITTEKETSAPHLRHRAAPATGEYRGRKVVDVEKKLAKKLAKQTEREKQHEKLSK